MKKIAIIGSSDLAVQVSHLALSTKQYNLVGCFDDFAPKGTKVGESFVIGQLDEVYEWYNEKRIDALVVGVGYARIEYRKKVFQKFSSFIPFANIIHETAIIDDSAKLGQGLVIMAGCIVDFFTTIEDNVLLNIGSKIAHHSIIKSHSFLAPNVSVAGFTTIGECCNLGISTTVINNVLICDYVRTGAATTLINNIDVRGLYIGTPARLLKES